MTSWLNFEKYHGLGNDFVIVEPAFPSGFTPELARAVADRRVGVGCDQLLVVVPPSLPMPSSGDVIREEEEERSRTRPSGYSTLTAAWRRHVETAPG